MKEAFNFSFELEKTCRGMSTEVAQEILQDLRKSIEDREAHRECACGTPCKNYFGHMAVDNLIAIKMRRILAISSKEEFTK